MSIFFYSYERLLYHQTIIIKNLLVRNDIINTEDLNKRANRVEHYEEAINIIKEYQDIIKTNKKNIIFFAYQHGKVFKRFKENGNFKNLLERFKITKSTIIFKTNIVKLIDKYPKIKTSSISLNFLNIYYKNVKNF